MRKKGRVASWIDDKGYGFIEPLAGGARLFLHVSAIDDGYRRPSIGDTVTYEEVRDEKGRLRAARATLAGGQAAGRNRRPGLTAGLAAILLVGCVVTLVLSGKVQSIVVVAYLVVSLITFGFYAFDKFAARRGNSRVPESTLHALGVAGGWPGALIAQQLFRHKTRKQPFRSVFWMTVVINLAALGWLQSGEVRAYTESLLQETLETLLTSLQDMLQTP